MTVTALQRRSADAPASFAARTAATPDLVQRRADGADLSPSAQPGYGAQREALAVQCKGGAPGGGVHDVAAQGVAGSGGSLPHLATIQASFGRHDVSHVQAFVGGAAKTAGQQMGAEGYAMADKVAFQQAPSLHLAAHEAAHVIQQKGGVSLAGGVGKVGDAHERHADAVADLVVAGQSAEALLDPYAGGGASKGVQSKAVQLNGKKNALKTTQGDVTDWASAVTHVAGRWRHVQRETKRGLENWHKKVEKDAPPPAWQAILTAAVSVTVGAVTGGLGAVILKKVGDKLGEFVINAAVEAGKGAIAQGVDAGVSAAMSDNPGDAPYQFMKAQEDANAKVIEEEEKKTAVKCSEIATKPDAEKWKAMQAMYNAVNKSRRYARKKAHDEALFGFYSMQAKQEYGTDCFVAGRNVMKLKGFDFMDKMRLWMHVKEGEPLNKLPASLKAKLKKRFAKRYDDKDANLGLKARTKTDLDELKDKIDTSSVGTIGFHLKRSSDPSAAVEVDYCEIEEGKKDDTAVREYLLKSSKKIKHYRMPKVVIAEKMPSRHHLLPGNFEIAWDETNQSTWQSWGGGAAKDSSDDNAGAAWLAGHGKKTTRELSANEINKAERKGVKRIQRTLFNRSLKALGVTEIHD